MICDGKYGKIMRLVGYISFYVGKTSDYVNQIKRKGLVRFVGGLFLSFALVCGHV